MIKENWKLHINGRGTPVSSIIDKFWATRGVVNPETFLKPVGNIYPYTAFKNIEKAGQVFINHMRNNSKFLIYADVDTDGCSSAAILYHYLAEHDVEATVYINEKKVHGITDKFFEQEIDADIIVVVDSLNDTMEHYNRIKSLNKDLIILDHHVPADIILQNAAELNLVSSAIDYPNPHLSGSGVTWKFVSYIDYILHTSYARNLVDLASVGIIADVCSVGIDSMENREICYEGFKNVVNSGIESLVGLNTLTADAIGFSIAPLVNAANRMNENKLAIELFLCDNTTQGKKIVKELTQIRDKQRSKVKQLFEKFDGMVENQIDNSCYYFIVDEDCDTLAGLLATKAVDKWKRPCVVLHESESQYAGSMRATGVDDFRGLVNSSGLGECFGHESSAGIVIPKENFESFKQYIEVALKDITFSQQTNVDLVLDRAQLTPLLLEKFQEINKITGANFPAVKVLIENVRNYTVKPLSQGKHLCIETSDMKFLVWNFNHWEDVIEGGVLSAIGGIDRSFFGGKYTTQMLMEDYKFETAPKQLQLW